MSEERSPFDLLESRFRLLCAGSRALCLPGDLLGGAYIGGRIPLFEVREALLRRGTDFGTRDAVMAELVRRARTGDPWSMGIGGVLLPGLRAAIGRLVRAHRWHARDLEAETLLGLLEAVHSVRLERGRIAASLIWAARRHADKALARELREADRVVPMERALAVRRAGDEAGAEGERALALAVDCRNPEMVLVEARVAGVLSAWEADVIGATRVARIPAREYAEELGEGLGSMRLKRYRAERRLVDWIATR